MTVWSYAGRHQAEGLLHRTPIALCLAQELSTSVRLFLSVKNNNSYNKKQQQQQTKTRWMPIQKQDLASAMGIMRRARDVDKYPQAQPHGNRRRQAENADQDVAVR